MLRYLYGIIFINQLLAMRFYWKNLCVFTILINICLASFFYAKQYLAILASSKEFIEVAELPSKKVPDESNRPISVQTATVVNAPISTTEPVSIVIPNSKRFIEVTSTCGAYFDEEDCLNVRSGPGTEYSVVTKLRRGVVLRVAGQIIESDGTQWYQVIFDEWIRYPERVAPKWYVAAEYVRAFSDIGQIEFDPATSPTTSKRILVDRSNQTLTAYEGDNVYMTATTSTGRDEFPTPRGTFTIFRKTPSRYMQGPLPNIPDSSYYDLPGVPWNLYFTEQGAVIHGAYWHNSFGIQYSHGCVNLTPAMAERLYHWADIGTTVVVRD